MSIHTNVLRPKLHAPFGNEPGICVLVPFQAKWIPVRVKKTRQHKNPEHFHVFTKRKNALDRPIINGDKSFAWQKLSVVVAVATLMLSGAVSAQDSGPKPLLNCHPPSAAAPGKPSPVAKQNKAWDSQDAGAGIILPSAGGGSTSAAPSVQRHGLPVEVRNDCPPVAGPPKGQKPDQ